MNYYNQSNKDPNLKYVNFSLQMQTYEVIMHSDNPVNYDMQDILIHLIRGFYDISKVDNKKYKIELMGATGINISTEFSIDVEKLLTQVNQYISSREISSMVMDYKKNFEDLDIYGVRFYIKNEKK